jgi:hypothetical protein
VSQARPSLITAAAGHRRAAGVRPGGPFEFEPYEDDELGVAYDALVAIVDIEARR